MEAREGGAEKVVSPIPVFLIAFVAIMGGALLGITLRRFLPGHHLAEDSKDFVRLGTGLIGTMAALVLFGTSDGQVDQRPLRSGAVHRWSSDC